LLNNGGLRAGAAADEECGKQQGCDQDSVDNIA
jgi:hypothetical protein